MNYRHIVRITLLFWIDFQYFWSINFLYNTFGNILLIFSYSAVRLAIRYFYYRLIPYH